MKTTSTDSNCNNSSESNKTNCCNAFGCNLESSNKIDIDCGTYGTLTIFVCKSCINKFRIGGQ